MTKPIVKVSREGIVSSDGTPIGKVVKEMRQGLFMALSTAIGVGYSGAGTPFWIPFDVDGKQLSDGYDTRKRAVERVSSHAKPLTIDGFKIEQGFMGSGYFLSAWVTYQGFSFGVSRYPSESLWTIDCLFTPDSMMPTFSNGSGTRFTRAKGLKEEFDKATTEAAIASGLWPIVDPATTSYLD